MTINPDLLTVSSDEQQAMRVLSSTILFMLRIFNAWHYPVVWCKDTPL